MGDLYILNQLDVQRRGGICAKYPSACVVRDMLREAELLKPLRPIRVLDLTFGQGVFYAAINAIVFAFDIQRLDWVTKPYMFYQKPCWAYRRYLDEIGDVDVVVIDPPWAQWDHRGSRRARNYYSEALGRPEDILMCGINAAHDLGKPLLYHWREPLTNYKHIVGPIQFRGRSRYIKQPRPSYYGVIEVH